MRQYSVDEAVGLANKITHAISFLVEAVATFIIGVILIKLLWAWTIPDLFPGAVDQGLISGSLGWLAALKTAALVAIMSSTATLIAGRRS